MRLQQTGWWRYFIVNNVEDIKNSIPDFAKDIRLNFSSIIMNSVYEDDLTYGCAYACALSLNDKKLSKALENECRNRISEDFVISIKSTVSIMSLNNIWYSYRDSMPSTEMKVSAQRMRVNIMGSYAGLSKVLFESISLCISAINGCKFCIKSHSQLLIDEDQTKDYVLNIGRIASVIKATVKSIEIEN